MRRCLRYAPLALGVCASLALLAGAFAQPVPVGGEDKDKPTQPKQPVQPKLAGQGPSGAPNEIVQTFPTKGPMQSAWAVRYTTASGFGLIIQDAWFKRSPNDRWVQILGDARLSEAFVPYHRGSPRFWDVSYNFGLCVNTEADAGPHGTLITPPGQKAPTVVKEVRDRGLMWKDGRGVRRGEEMLLWATLSAANYRYVIQYGFQDTGTITFRCGSTGHNYGGSEFVGHMHNSLWRVDVNLDGPNNNSVLVCEHVEPVGEGDDARKARTETRLLETEGFVDWDRTSSRACASSTPSRRTPASSPGRTT
jgi:hypothetical protein